MVVENIERENRKEKGRVHTVTPFLSHSLSCLPERLHGACLIWNMKYVENVRKYDEGLVACKSYAWHEKCPCS